MSCWGLARGDCLVFPIDGSLVVVYWLVSKHLIAMLPRGHPDPPCTSSTHSSWTIRFRNVVWLFRDPRPDLLIRKTLFTSLVYFTYTRASLLSLCKYRVDSIALNLYRDYLLQLACLACFVHFLGLGPIVITILEVGLGYSCLVLNLGVDTT